MITFLLSRTGSTAVNQLRTGSSYGMLNSAWGGGGMVDASDLKSAERKLVRVRLPPALLIVKDYMQPARKQIAVEDKKAPNGLVFARFWQIFYILSS